MNGNPKIHSYDRNIAKYFSVPYITVLDQFLVHFRNLIYFLLYHHFIQRLTSQRDSFLAVLMLKDREGQTMQISLLLSLWQFYLQLLTTGKFHP
jgi:hypothetical protein